MLLAIAIGVVLADAFLFLAAPKFMGGEPMFINPSGDRGGVPSSLVVLGVVAVLIVVGLVWMIRIHRADPEPDHHAWRYREARLNAGQTRVAGRPAWWLDPSSVRRPSP